jgi:hypothetical protein
LSTLIGTVTLTRAVDDASLANRIAAAAEAALLSQPQKPKRPKKSKG